MENIHHSKEYHPYTTESYCPIKVRCPHCLKPYAVNPNRVQGSQPRFACLSCGKKFWIAYPESVGAGELIGFPLEWLKSEPSSFATRQISKKTKERVSQRALEKTALQGTFQKDLVPCPKCYSPFARGTTECPHCGVLIDRWDDFQKLKKEKDQGVSASSVLRKAWEEVLDNYEDEKIHNEFLFLCQQEDNLVYASRQYGRLLSAHGGDEVAKKMYKKMEALSQVALNASRRKSQVLKAKPWGFSGFILFLSFVLVGIGFFLEPWRNMVGVGVALLFFTLAFRSRFSTKFK